MAASMIDNCAMNPETLEALALLRSLQLSMRKGIQILIVESDCLLLVEEITIAASSNSALGNIIS